MRATDATRFVVCDVQVSIYMAQAMKNRPLRSGQAAPVVGRVVALQLGATAVPGMQTRWFIFIFMAIVSI